MVKKINPMLLVALFSIIIAIVAGQNMIGKLLGLPGNVDIYVKDTNGDPIANAVCYINPAGLSTCSDPMRLNSNGNMVCQIKTFSSSSGRCAFSGIPGGEIQPWGVACSSAVNGGKPTKQGSVEVFQPSFGSTRTSNVYVTLSNCVSTSCPGCHDPATTTTSTTLANCNSHASYKCYNGDVWYYDSCGQRQDRAVACGTFGCSNGKCMNAPSTTSPPVTVPTTTVPGATTTTQPPGCVDSCMGSGCSTDADGNGFRCVTNTNGCHGWAMDSTCDASAEQTNYIAIGAGVIGMSVLLLYLSRRK